MDLHREHFMFILVFILYAILVLLLLFSIRISFH